MIIRDVCLEHLIFFTKYDIRLKIGEIYIMRSTEAPVDLYQF